jgi:hypothetical protein
LAASLGSLLSISILAVGMVSLRQRWLGFICFGMLGLAVVLVGKVLDKSLDRSGSPVNPLEKSQNLR